MNDRFKFRVWDKEVGKMFTPLRHFNFCNVNGTIVCIESFCQYDGFYQKRIIKEFNDAILMQCTGLKDKNGKLIYEGDVVKIIFKSLNQEIIDIVEWDNTSARFIFEKFGQISMYNYAETWEVIGNIYENKELLDERN